MDLQKRSSRFGDIMSQVEKSEYCRELISQRISDGLADAAALSPDVMEWDWSMGDLADGLLGGFPCQPRSSKYISS